jgi:hypothetical protein
MTHHVRFSVLERVDMTSDADEFRLRNVGPRWQSEVIVADDARAFHAQEDVASVDANVAIVLKLGKKISTTIHPLSNLTSCPSSSSSSADPTSPWAEPTLSPWAELAKSLSLSSSVSTGAVFTAKVARGTMPPVDLRDPCFVRAIKITGSEYWERTKGKTYYQKFGQWSRDRSLKALRRGTCKHNQIVGL